jgi:folate-binding protein YgfZ
MNQTADQYHIISAGCGWVDRRDRGRLRFDGPDAKAFLHALLTNDIQSLSRGQSVYAAYLTPQGRMIADMTIHDAGEFLLADVPPGLAPALAVRFDQVIFAEDVKVTDVSDAMFQRTLIGPASASVAQAAATPACLVFPAVDVGLPTVEVFGDMVQLEEVTRGLEDAGAVSVSNELFEALRIDAGRPAFGVDMTEETIPLEAGLLDRAISTTKGCYVGQEVIIRVLHRGGGRVAKRLVRLDVDPAAREPLRAGTPIDDGGREVGRITSAAISPARGFGVALGYVHRDSAEIGRVLAARTEGAGVPVTIVGFAGHRSEVPEFRAD